MANIDISWAQIKSLSNKVFKRASDYTDDTTSEAVQNVQEDIDNAINDVTASTSEKIDSATTEAYNNAVADAKTYTNNAINISEDVNTVKPLKSALTWSANNGLQIKSAEDNNASKVQIRPIGMLLYDAKGSAKAQVTTEGFKAPNLVTTMIYFSNNTDAPVNKFIFEYMSDDSIVLKKV